MRRLAGSGMLAHAVESEAHMAALAQNCWEFMQCGREPGGLKVAEFGVCPAALDTATRNLLGGKCRGRVCWVVMGTLCAGAPHKTFAQKRLMCRTCEFFEQVRQEHVL
jgi:hypothetical protein